MNLSLLSPVLSHLRIHKSRIVPGAFRECSVRGFAEFQKLGIPTFLTKSLAVIYPFV
jgi:hypothetical protein